MEEPSDFLGGVPLGNELEDFALSRRQQFHRAGLAAGVADIVRDHVFGDGRAEIGFPARDCLDRDFELLAALVNATICQPALFVAGEKDVCITMYRDAYDAMEQTMPTLAGKHLLPGAGHWVQQERPREVNELLVGFLKGARKQAG